MLDVVVEKADLHIREYIARVVRFGTPVAFGWGSMLGVLVEPDRCQGKPCHSSLPCLHKLGK